MKYVNQLKNWLESQELEEYTDEYENWCFGNKIQKHIMHLHPYNTNADMEINDMDLFNEIKEEHDLEVHPWHDDWVIVKVTDEKAVEIVKAIVERIMN